MSDLPGWVHVHSGKVRDLYRPVGGDVPVLLLVASDRVSAFDFALEPAIPGKGATLTALSNFWFDALNVPNHRAVETESVPPIPAKIADRATLCQALDILPIECVVRGYLTGSGWVEYQQSSSVCGVPLPAGLHDGDRLPEPIFTPAFKAPAGEHDENISFERTVEIVGQKTAEALRELSIRIYEQGSRIAAEKGVILADTKFEFGTRPDGEITLADEVLTPDSSRFWDAEAYAAGSTPKERMASFDKQIVRNWLLENWNREGTPPELPARIVEQTAARYRELADRFVS